MMMKKCAAAAALLAISAGALADGTYEFDRITKLSLNGRNFTGVLVNDTVPTSLSVDSASSECAKWMQLVMTYPENFTLTVVVATTPAQDGFPALSRVSNCELNAKP